MDILEQLPSDDSEDDFDGYATDDTDEDSPTQECLQGQCKYFVEHTLDINYFVCLGAVEEVGESSASFTNAYAQQHHKELLNLDYLFRYKNRHLKKYYNTNENI